MGDNAKATKKVIIWLTKLGTLVTTGPLDSSAWYVVNKRASTGSTLPVGFNPDSTFRTAETTPPTLIAGDEVYPLLSSSSNDEPIAFGNELCKTDAETSGEEGTLVTTDSCSNGYETMILDGFVTLSGSFAGFLKFDGTTGELTDQTLLILKKFFDFVTDDGAGTYTYTPKLNERVLMMMLLNSDATEIGQFQNWLTSWILLTGITIGGSLKDIQKKDTPWTKGEGPATLYQRTVTAGDALAP